MRDFLKGTVTPKDWAFVAVVLSITGILCVLYFFLFHKPSVEELDGMQIHLTELQGDLQRARETNENIDALREEANKMETLVDLFEDRLPERREIPSLLAKFEGLGDNIGLRVELTQLPTSMDASKETIPYQARVRGNFHQIVTFINLLERDERYLKISDIDVREENIGVSEATFTLSTFRFVQPIAGRE